MMRPVFFVARPPTYPPWGEGPRRMPLGLYLPCPNTHVLLMRINVQFMAINVCNSSHGFLRFLRFLCWKNLCTLCNLWSLVFYIASSEIPLIHGTNGDEVWDPTPHPPPLEGRGAPSWVSLLICVKLCCVSLLGCAESPRPSRGGDGGGVCISPPPKTIQILLMRINVQFMAINVCFRHMDFLRFLLLKK